MVTLTLLWPAILAPAHPFPQHLTAIQPRRHLHLSSQEWAARVVLRPFFPCPTCRLATPLPVWTHTLQTELWRFIPGTMDLAQMDSNVVLEQLALQMQIYALNNGGMVSDSKLSLSLTPSPRPQYNPWTYYLQMSNAFGGRHEGIAESTASMRSSPSHQPAPLLRTAPS